VTTIPQNRPRLYIKILQCAKRLARHDEAPADVLDAILSGVVRGDFDGHMKHKRSSHPSECPEFYDDCDDWSSEDFIGGFLHYGGPNFGKPIFDPPHTSREGMVREVVGLSYGQYAEFFRQSYIDPICIEERFLVEWWKLQNVHESTEKKKDVAVGLQKGGRNAARRNKTWDWTIIEAKLQELVLYHGKPNRSLDPSWTRAGLVELLEQFCVDTWRESPSRPSLYARIDRTFPDWKAGE
jgi:hypothetical protein